MKKPGGETFNMTMSRLRGMDQAELVNAFIRISSSAQDSVMGGRGVLRENVFLRFLKSSNISST